MKCAFGNDFLLSGEMTRHPTNSWTLDKTGCNRKTSSLECCSMPIHVSGTPDMFCEVPLPEVKLDNFKTYIIFK